MLDDPAGFYGPDSVAWRLNREAMLLLGAGPRALLMQIAHPLVAEGVEQHSNFRVDPWARLRDTLRSAFLVVYGSGVDARSEIRRLNTLHRSIAGPVADPLAREIGGTSYSARDPELLLWVHATLVDSTLVGYESWIEPLSETDRAAYYLETRPIGRAFGIPDDLLPADLPAFEAYLARMLAPDGPIRVSQTARELAVTILHPPPALPWAPAASERRHSTPRWAGLAEAAVDHLGHFPPELYDWTVWPALELLPRRLRDEFDIPWTPWRRLVSRWLLTGFQLWRPLIPTSLRWVAQARAADERMARTARRWPSSASEAYWRR